MDQSTIVKRIEEICHEFDSRVSAIGLLGARVELAKQLSETESAAEELGVSALQTTNTASTQCRSHMSEGSPCLIDASWMCRKDACLIIRAAQRT